MTGGLYMDEHEPKAARPATPAPLLRAADALRRLPTDNPHWPSDALLQLGDALNEAAIYLEIHHAMGAADGVRAVQRECRRLEASARALAPVLALPLTQKDPDA